MTVYWSGKPIDWHRSVPDVDWLGIDAPRGPLPYPPVLDVVESALVRRPTPLLEASAAALAPRWDDLGQIREPAELMAGDVPDEGDYETEERFVLYAAAWAVGELGAPYGCVVAVEDHMNPNLRYFLAQLARRADRSGFTLACAGSVAALPPHTLPRRAARPVAQPVPLRVTRLTRLSAADRRALAVLAVSPSGAPLAAARHVGLSREASEALALSGPGGVGWIALSERVRRELRAGLAACDRRRHAAELFDAWPPDGWGYLRRAQLGVVSGDRTRLLAQNGAMFAGCAVTGRDLLQRHVAALADVPAFGDAPGPARHHRITAHVAAARLASRQRAPGRAHKEATRHLRAARKLASEPIQRIDLTAELANTLALQRKSGSLAMARTLYEQSFRALSAIDNPVERARLEITLLNGLALIEYFQGADQSALTLEERAEKLALDLTEQRPALARWAFSLIGVNTAKLLTSRFGDRQRAIAKLNTALKITRSSSEDAKPVRRKLAQLHFTEGDYQNVVRVLDGLYPEGRPGNTNPREEFRDRLLLALAQLGLGQASACQAQLEPLRVLAVREGSDEAVSLLDSLLRSSTELQIETMAATVGGGPAAPTVGDGAARTSECGPAVTVWLAGMTGGPWQDPAGAVSS